MAIILRRRKLGRTSCREIARIMSRILEKAVGVVRNDNPIPLNDDVLIRWGCTSQVAIKNVVNSVEAIHEVNDKLGFRRVLNEQNLCPETYFDVNEAEVLVMGGSTLIVRPDRHAQGRHLHVCSTVEELRAACRRYPRYYISKLINKVAEYRVFIVQGRVACVAKKTPGNPDQVAWNVAQGGRFDNVRFGDWPLKAVKASIEAFNLTKLDFGGVDVMVDAENNAYILEINSAPSLTSPYRQECMAKALSYLIKVGKERIPLVQEKGGYTKFVHPAIDAKAKLVGGV